jgi:hypothetical protein
LADPKSRRRDGAERLVPMHFRLWCHLAEEGSDEYGLAQSLGMTVTGVKAILRHLASVEVARLDGDLWYRHGAATTADGAGGLVKCLCCGGRFASVDRVAIRMCDQCKKRDGLPRNDDPAARSRSALRPPVLPARSVPRRTG